jgi:hypothetical protein
MVALHPVIKKPKSAFLPNHFRVFASALFHAKWSIVYLDFIDDG